MSLTDDLSDGFFRKVKIMCANLRCNPEDILQVWFSESIGIYADQPNQFGADAWGINQMSEKTIKGFGFDGTMPEYLQLSAEAQLQYVAKYYDPMKGQLISAVRIYQINFLPATVGHEQPGGIIAASDSANSTIRNAYNSNKSYFDKANKGYIALGDLQRAMDESTSNSRPNRRKGVPLADRWKEILNRLNNLITNPVLIAPPGLLNSWWAVTTPEGNWRYFFEADGDVQWTRADNPKVIADSTGEWSLEAGRLKITWKTSIEFWNLPINPADQKGDSALNNGIRGIATATKESK